MHFLMKAADPPASTAGMGRSVLACNEPSIRRRHGVNKKKPRMHSSGGMRIEKAYDGKQWFSLPHLAGTDESLFSPRLGVHAAPEVVPCREEVLLRLELK